MIVREKALEIVNNCIPILYSENKMSIRIFKDSLIDTEASLISELSTYNNLLFEMVEFNKDLINNEYIDYLEDKINTISDKTMSENSARKLSSIAISMRNISRNFNDSEFKERIDAVEGKISELVKHDISKSSSLKPETDSKINDFINSLEERVKELSDKYMYIYRGIINCELLIECCDFCNYLYSSNLSSTNGYLTILEEPYINIVNEFMKKYYDFKGEPECPYL